MAKRIIVVDDELDIRTYISTLLESQGFKTVVAPNGEAGMEKVRQSKPDLITLDIMMPQESGIKMYRDLKMDPELKDIPVVVISAMAQKTFLHSQKLLDQFRGQTVPEPEGYIEKPPEPEELMDEVIKVLGDPTP